MRLVCNVVFLTFVFYGCELSNDPPTITGLLSDPGIIGIGGNSILTCKADDPDGDDLEYTWQSLFGSIAGEGSIVTWTAPDSNGVYAITCTVDDGNGGQDIGEIFVTVNSAPIAFDLTIKVLQGIPIEITLNASDADEDTLEYTIVAFPVHGQLAGVPPNLIYTSATNFSGTDSLKYEVTDGEATSNIAKVNIIIGTLNKPPIAQAGSDIDVTVLNSVTLDGTGSIDPDGSFLSYLWVQTSGPTVLLSDSTSAQPTFSTSDETETLSFSLFVTDDSLAQSEPDEVIVNIHTWVTASAGNNFSLAIRSDGTLWGWGSNSSSQLGQNRDQLPESHTPIQIGLSGDWSTVSAGINFALAIKTDGTLWSWGSNSNGALGHGFASNNPTHTPTKVGNTYDWIDVEAGISHSLGMKIDGSIWSWGENIAGELGLGNFDSIYVPTQIDTITSWIDIAVGEHHNIALRSDKTLWAWGANIQGQLGDGTQLIKKLPVQIGSGSQWLTVAAGSVSSGAIRDDGTLWTWGNMVNGLGMIQNGSASDWNSITIGGFHILMWNLISEAWALGENSKGELGNGTTEYGRELTQIGSEANWLMLSAGGMNTFLGGQSLGIKTNGSLWAWGFNSYGQLGIGTSDIDPHTYPLLVGEIPD